MLKDVDTVLENCKSGQYRVSVELETAFKNVRVNCRDLISIFVKRAIGNLPTAQKEAEDVLRFIATAYVDEKFIQLDWDMSNAWSGYPLEMELFGTRNAGTEVFKFIDNLNPERIASRVYAVLFYLVLSLGFAGKYEPETDRELLLNYQERLYDIINKSFDVSALASEATYQDLSVRENALQRSYLPTSRGYNIAVIVMLAVGALSLQLLWYFQSNEVVTISKNIIELGY